MKARDPNLNAADRWMDMFDPVERTAILAARLRHLALNSSTGSSAPDEILSVVVKQLELDGRLESESPATRVYAAIVGERTRVIDAAIARGGARQVLCLAAGLDTRPLRLGLETVAWIHVDTPRVTALAQRLLAPHASAHGIALEFVALHLEDLQVLWPRLSGAGLSLREPIAVILEGVSEYLLANRWQMLAATLRDALPKGSSVIVAFLTPAMIAFAHSSGDTSFPFAFLAPPEERMQAFGSPVVWLELRSDVSLFARVAIWTK